MDRKSLDPNTEIMRFWSSFHHSMIPTFHIGGIKPVLLKTAWFQCIIEIPRCLIIISRSIATDNGPLTTDREYSWQRNGQTLLFIAVVINMFRLPDFLTGENIVCNSQKLFQTWQPLYYFFWKKSRLLCNDVPYFNQLIFWLMNWILILSLSFWQDLQD